MPQKMLTKQKASLNEQQLQMLKLFKKPMAEEDYNEIRRTIVKVLARNIDTEMASLEQERGWDANTYEQWGKEHMRTPGKK